MPVVSGNPILDEMTSSLVVSAIVTALIFITARELVSAYTIGAVTSKRGLVFRDADQVQFRRLRGLLFFLLSLSMTCVFTLALGWLERTGYDRHLGTATLLTLLYLALLIALAYLLRRGSASHI